MNKRRSQEVDKLVGRDQNGRQLRITLEPRLLLFPIATGALLQEGENLVVEAEERIGSTYTTDPSIPEVQAALGVELRDIEANEAIEQFQDGFGSKRLW